MELRWLEQTKAAAALDCALADRKVVRWPIRLGTTPFFLLDFVQAASGARASLPVLDASGAVVSRLDIRADGSAYRILDVAPDGALLIGDRGGLLLAPFDPERAAFADSQRISDRLAWDAKFADAGRNIVFYRNESPLAFAGTDLRHSVWLWDRAIERAAPLDLGVADWNVGPILVHGEAVALTGRFHAPRPSTQTGKLAAEDGPRAVHYFSAASRAPETARSWGELAARAHRGEGVNGAAEGRAALGVIGEGAILVHARGERRLELHQPDGRTDFLPYPAQGSALLANRLAGLYPGEVALWPGGDGFLLGLDWEAGAAAYRLDGSGGIQLAPAPSRLVCSAAHNFAPLLQELR